MQRHAHAKTGALVALVLAVLVSIVHLTSAADARETTAEDLTPSLATAQPSAPTTEPLTSDSRPTLQICAVGPACVTDLTFARDFAFAHVGEIGPDEKMVDTRSDAARHCLLSGYLTVVSYDPQWAQELLHTHEMEAPEKDLSPAANAMDLHNNEIGRRLVENAGMVHWRFEWLPLSGDEEQKIIALCREQVGRAIHVTGVGAVRDDDGVPVVSLSVDEPNRPCNLDYRVCSIDNRLVYLDGYPAAPAPAAATPPTPATSPTQPAPDAQAVPPVQTPLSGGTPTAQPGRDQGQVFHTQRIPDGFLVKSKDRPLGPKADPITGGPNGDANGVEVRVVCEGHGPAVDGLPYTVWDRLDDGTWVYGYYLTTPGDGFHIDPSVPTCPGY